MSDGLGSIVRHVWTEWAREQPDPKPSWLTPWNELDDGQREVDVRIGVAVAAAECERIRQLLLACQDCDRIHELHPAIGYAPESGKPFGYDSWAAPDGHAYRAPRLDHAAIAALLDAPTAPAIPTEGTTP